MSLISYSLNTNNFPIILVLDYSQVKAIGISVISRAFSKQVSSTAPQTNEFKETL